MPKISLLKIVESTTVDGPGIRTSIYCAGCVNACKGCHNPQSWAIENGIRTDIEDILKKIREDDARGVTFSGGDPMLQATAFTELARRIHTELGKNIWCYTGYTFEQIINDEAKKALMSEVDVVVDGRFMIELKNADLLFRGSSNQRILDAKKSLKAGKPVEYNYNPYPEFADIDKLTDRSNR